MKTYNYKFTYNNISFQYSNTNIFEEREIHSYHEILYCKNTDAVFFTENSKHKIKGTALFVIPKDKYHFFDTAPDKEFIRLKIIFPQAFFNTVSCLELMSNIRVITEINLNLQKLLDKLCETAKTGNDKRGFYAYSTALMLLCELDSLKESTAVSKTAKQDIAYRLAEHISNNLSAELSLKTLSKKFNMSESAISHIFKNSLGISVHSYIARRRLSLAHNLILCGEKPTKIYFSCGYKNYSTFYKAYINYFGHEPSGEEK